MSSSSSPFGFCPRKTMMSCRNIDLGTSVLDLLPCRCSCASSSPTSRRISFRNYSKTVCRIGTRSYGGNSVFLRRDSGICRAIPAKPKETTTLVNEDGEGETAQWSSILVPCVQEMVKEKTIKTVPPRYVRSDEDETDEVSDGSGINAEIPIIDMSRLCSSTDMDSEIEKLDSACKEWGFFQLVNHGIESSFLDKLKFEIEGFFNLPLEEKKKVSQKPNQSEGFGQLFVFSEDQKLDWADMFYIVMQPVGSRDPDLLPKLPLSLRDTLETYSDEVKSIAKILFSKIARALKIKAEEMEEVFDDDLLQSMRLNYYPPCPEPHKVMGLSPHSDLAGLTILLQVNEVEGLQIKKDGKWVNVKPLSNAFIVNVGDVLEIITNGTYRSIEHRGVVNSEKERLSIATFNNPGMSKRFGPMKELVDKDKTALFKNVTFKEYREEFFSRELKGKAYLDAMRIQEE